jgi:replication factor C subunit 3/5
MLCPKKIDLIKVKRNNLIKLMSYLLKHKEKINEIIFDNYNFDNKYSNMLVYGLDDINIKYFLKCVLENIYGKIDIKKSDYEIKNVDNSKNSIEIKCSDYHIEWNPMDSGVDKYAFISLMSDYGENPMVNMVLEETKDYKRTIVINLIDDLNSYGQACLRRNIEKYANITRFILISKNLSKVSEPIRSRCSIVKIPKLSVEKKKIIVKNLFEKKYNLDYKNDICKLLLDIELLDRKLSKQKVLGDYIEKIFAYEKKELSLTVIKSVKKVLYDLYISNYSLDNILIEINNYVVNSKIENKKKYDIIKRILETNICINEGKRYLIHLESLVFYIFKIKN